MRKYFLLLLIVHAFTSCTYENNDLYDSYVVVTGTVSDAKTLKPIHNAVVYANLIVASSIVSERDAGTSIVRTDHKGRFTALMNFDESDIQSGGYYYINYTVTHKDYIQYSISEWASNINILLEPK